MVGDTLKVSDDVEELGDFVAIAGVHVLGRKLDQIGADHIFVYISLILCRTDLSGKIITVFGEGFEEVKAGVKLKKNINKIEGAENDGN